MSDVTALLNRAAQGDKLAEDEVLRQVHSELRRIAARQFRNEKPCHTLQPSALVHEAYLRLIGQNGVAWTSRAHFYGFAAHVMREVLVDYGRRRSRSKRGNGNEPLSDIDEALQRLEHRNPRQAKVVELKFFGGFPEEEMAETLGVTARTVRRDWTVARAWLYGKLSA
jgi:DNA-directed RNA polymerase specialized sigma24 family protein